MINSNISRLVNHYAELDAEIKSLEAEKKALKSKLLGLHIKKLESRDHVIQIQERTTNRFSIKDFRADHPKMAENYTQATTSKVVTVIR